MLAEKTGKIKPEKQVLSSEGSFYYFQTTFLDYENLSFNEAVNFEEHISMITRYKIVQNN